MAQTRPQPKTLEVKVTSAEVGKIPPQAIEAEQSVLGALLIDKDAIVKVAETLTPSHFYREPHAEIYRAILTLYEKRLPADLVTVTDELKKNNKYDLVGGAGYLSSLVNMVPTAANIEHYAVLVKDRATKRALISAAGVIAESAFREDTEIKDLMDKAETSLFGISQEHLKQNFIPIKDALAESFDRLDELHKKGSGLRGIATGFTDIDKKLSGLQDSTLTIIAARPSMGKTTLAMNMIQHVGVKEKVPVGIFSLEMGKEQLVDLMLASQADVDAWKITTGNLQEEDFEKISEAMGELAEAPIYLDDTPGISIMEMRTKARRLQMESGLKLLFVDYLQLIHGRNLENRVQEVSEISQALKNLARELKIPVVAISQLSRAVESRQTRVPQLADLRESGAIEQDADVVMFIYREDADDTENVKLTIAKHRNGPLGEIDLKFKGERRRFYAVEKVRG
ncbi:MAG: replicative DNA helicase [Candidatus Woykebacteria bacterium RIFCSPHIGHO2_12_FULL_45_10]|uniref:Replicative DNA helicase n=1 Tax=Candidatus Woykebacteria bacterium RIFCSPHIGHO2_12_FULL_45_10 TaxID=1802603 RepID=A0A1G1WRB8_9BACT|nr:MAG: replicative DNA helicase [Candidatus Woykebacteria bacterium RIFCSPHIGHO2_12_FULL_45_10]